MKGFLRAACVALGAMFLLSVPSARAQVDYSGVWTLNSAASDLGGVPAPKSDVITITQSGKSFAWREVIVSAKSIVYKEAWSGALDGVARPVTGPPNAKASYSANGTSRWIDPQGNSDLLMTISADGKQFVLLSSSTSPGGKTMQQKFVYERKK